MNEEEKQAYDYLEKYIEWETLGERNLEGDIKTILNLIDKQQKEIEKRLKEIDALYKMMSVKDERIEDLKENNGYHLGFIDGGISKRYEMEDKIKEIIENHKKFLSNEFSKYDEDDIENRKAIQYASARLSFLLADIYKLGE